MQLKKTGSFLYRLFLSSLLVVYRIHFCWLFMAGTLPLPGEIRMVIALPAGGGSDRSVLWESDEIMLYFIEAKKKVEY